MNMVQGGINYVTDNKVYFYTPQFYALDNFSAFTVTIWGKTFMTAEHAYQWKKFAISNMSIADLIYIAPSPCDTKLIADQYRNLISKEWDKVKLGYMEEILRAKYSQHEKVQVLLMETGEREIIENSPTDTFWGIGADENGQNHLGRLWMKIRNEVR